MKSNNDSSQEFLKAEEKTIEETIKKYFWFLVEEYILTYKRTHERRFEFTSSEVRIELEIGHKAARIIIYRVGEPDFTRLIFERIVQYFEGRLDIDNLVRYFPDYPLEDNIRFMAKLFRSYAHRIINQIDKWWIPVQVFQYKLVEKDYKDSGQLEDFLTDFKEKHDYLKSKGAIE